MKWAPFSAGFSFVLVCAIAGSAAAQGKSSHPLLRRAARIEQVSSSAEVHIAPTTMSVGGTSIEVGRDRWSARGYDLKTLISQIYDIDVRQIDIAEDSSGNARYDVTLSLAHEVEEDALQQMLKTALEKKFQVKITPESRSMNVYVLTAPNGPGLALHSHGAGGAAKLMAASLDGSSPDDAGQITFFGKQCSGISSGGIAASAETMSDFRRTLEPELDGLLMNETNLKGIYDFKIGSYANQQELFQLMHEELGILVIPTQRSVTLMTVRPAPEMRAAI